MDSSSKRSGPRAKQNKRSHSCEHCDRKFSRPYMLENHLRARHTGEKPYVCSECPQRFSSSSFRSQHKMAVHSHGNSIQFGCPNCSKTFGCRKYLLQHQKIHDGSGAIIFQHCNKTYSSRRSLLHHIDCQHSSIPKRFSCTYCGKHFTKVDSLNCHVMTHTGELPYACPKCDHKFKTLPELTRHLGAIHGNERPYKCQHCECRFKLLSNLYSHTRSKHRGQRPRTHICTYCKKEFADSPDLTRHVRVHTGEKPYTCAICGYSCTCSSGLKKHQVVHLNERRHVCASCAKQFKTQQHPKKHTEAIHAATDNRQVVCPLCGKMFAMKGHLTRHVRVHTGEKALQV